MKNLDLVLYHLEELKIPTQTPLSPEDWKDWYHYILFDPVTSIRILFNISFSGRPKQGEITTTVQITIPDKNKTGKFNNFGFMKVVRWQQEVSQKLPLEITIPDFLNFEVSYNKSKIDIKRPQEQFNLEFEAIPKATPLLVPELFPYGTGFIGWGFIPGLKVKGTLKLNNQTIVINEKWYCYHDHNFGRFRWGDESVGWVWWVTSMWTKDNELFSFVFHRGNNKDFTKIGKPFLFIYKNNLLVKTFLGASIKITFNWTDKPERIPILPGGLASVFSHRKVLTPQVINVIAKDDLDDVKMDMHVDCKSEIILPDYQDKQYTFLKELNGSTTAKFTLNKKKYNIKKGLFYAEFVH